MYLVGLGRHFKKNTDREIGKEKGVNECLRECVDCPRREAFLAHLEQSRTEWRKKKVQARQGMSGWM